MPQLRLALNQIDSRVGDLAGNCETILRRTRHCAERGAHLVAFPEMVLTGYPVEDLALRSSFVEASRAALRSLAARLAEEGLGELPVVVGYLDRSESAQPRFGQPAGAPQNAGAVLYGGEVALTFAKHHLPNYGVFDEFRYFVPGDTMPVVRLHGVDVALAICEDLWQDGGRVPAARSAKAGLLLSVNASPYERDKDDTRLELVRKRAQEAGCTTAYLAMIGGQDELVFDGDSIVVDRDGEVVARAPQFAEECLILDLDLPAAAPDAPPPAWWTTGCASSGWCCPRNRCRRTSRSGRAGTPSASTTTRRCTPRWSRACGRTSARTASGRCSSACPAASTPPWWRRSRATRWARRTCTASPCRRSTPPSTPRGDAAELARRTGLNFRTVAIEPMFDAYMGSLGLTGLAEENLQSRLRGTLLMAISNQEGHIVLAPGNKSELAVGYSTLYGDSVGAYGPIKDVYKTSVFRLARWRNRAAEERGETPPIPENSLSKPPSAELRPGQVDTDSLPDYPVLDAILERYVDRDEGADAIVAAGFDRGLVTKTLRMVDTAEYKRRQYPPGTKISPKGFGKDRRLPITNGWRETA
ncbi:hypothetical protein GCM10020295_60180 [Streptomyces cinereospinus]